MRPLIVTIHSVCRNCVRQRISRSSIGMFYCHICACITHHREWSWPALASITMNLWSMWKSSSPTKRPPGTWSPSQTIASPKWTHQYHNTRAESLRWVRRESEVNFEGVFIGYLLPFCRKNAIFQYMLQLDYPNWRMLLSVSACQCIPSTAPSLNRFIRRFGSMFSSGSRFRCRLRSQFDDGRGWFVLGWRSRQRNVHAPLYERSQSPPLDVQRHSLQPCVRWQRHFLHTRECTAAKCAANGRSDHTRTGCDELYAARCRRTSPLKDTTAVNAVDELGGKAGRIWGYWTSSVGHRQAQETGTIHWSHW